MSMMSVEPKVYDDGRTKQAFKDACDINKILKKAQKAGSLAHILKYPEAVYGEFSGIDLLSAYGMINRAKLIFDDLPSEVRKEFKGDALAFAGYASDPANVGRLSELIPAIAEPGQFFPNPLRRTEEPPPAVSLEPDPAPPVVPVVPSEPPGDTTVS